MDMHFFWNFGGNSVIILLFQGLYYGGLFMFHMEKYDKAKEYIDRTIKLNPQSKEVS